MRTVAAIEGEAGRTQFRAEFNRGVDPDVAADRCRSVILIGEAPVDRFG